MKRVIAAVLLVAMVLTMAVSAFAWQEKWKINPKDGTSTWKKAPTNRKMPDSGSFWKAKYISGVWETSSAYVYKRNVGRATHPETMPKGEEQRHLNYLDGMKTVGQVYYLVAQNKYGSTVEYSYNF